MRNNQKVKLSIGKTQNMACEQQEDEDVHGPRLTAYYLRVAPKRLALKQGCQVNEAEKRDLMQGSSYGYP